MVALDDDDVVLTKLQTVVLEDALAAGEVIAGQEYLLASEQLPHL